VVATERKVCSVAGYAGTLDLIGTLKGELYVIDFKTSKAIYEPDYIMQVSAYKHAAEEGMYCDNGEWKDSQQEIKGLGVLRLDKMTGLPEWKPYTQKDSGRAFAMFMELLKYWWLINEAKEKEVSNGSISK